MSIETLIEAAEYVDNVETTTADEGSRTSNSQTMNSSQSNVKTSKDVTIQHWRKRAVAQSVKELNSSSDVSKSENLSNEKSAESLASAQKVGLLEPKGLIFKKPLSSVPKSGPSDAAQITSDDEKATKNERLLNGGCILGRPTIVDANITMTLPQTSTVIATPLLYAAVPFGNLPVHSSTSFVPIHGNTTSASGEVSGTPSQSLPGHRIAGEPSAEVSRKKSQLGAITREAHNKLEKSRRAHLKGCFDRLRNVIPNLRPKVSNLIILREALKCVQELEQHSGKLEEERDMLLKQKTVKEQRLHQLKGELLKYNSVSQLNELLRRVGQNGIPRPNGGGMTTAASSNPSTGCIVQPLPSTSLLSSPLDMPQTRTLKEVSVAPLQNKQSIPPLTSALLPSLSVSPSQMSTGNTLSSTMNLVWENSSDSRRVCTMLPAPQMLTSAQIRRSSEESSLTKPNVSSHVPLRYSPVSSLTHFKPISVSSESLTSVRSYTGRNLSSSEIPSFMEGRHSPLKIVVKPVDSAKQQARVVKSVPNHRKILKSVSTEEMPQQKSSDTPKLNELIFRPRSSITPPPPSNITPYFPRFSVGSGGSPPLTTAFPNMGDGSNHSTVDDYEQNDFNAWQPGARSDTELYVDDREKKQKATQKRKFLGAMCAAENTKIPKLQTLISKPCISAAKESMSSSTLASDGSEASKTPSQIKPGCSGLKITLPTLLPALSSALSSQSRSVTQVCFSTISSRPAVPTTSSHTPKGSGTSGVLGNFAIPAMPTFSIRTAGQNSQSNKYQFPVTLMAPIMSPSSGQTIIDPTGTARSNTGLTAESRPSSASSTDSHPGSSIKLSAPQVQYVVPMGYPSMVAMPNGASMAFPQAVGSFIPMMSPQGQTCGYMMPQGMFFAQNTMKAPQTPPVSASNSSNAGASMVENTNAKQQCEGGSVQNGSIFSPSKAMQPVVMAVQPGFVDSNANQNQNAATQQVQIMSPSFQPASPIMLPVAAEQGGGFVFGGAPTMMAPSQGATVGYQMPMNIIGYPVPMGGPPSIQFAMPQCSVSMPRGFGFGFPAGVQPTIMAMGSGGQNPPRPSGNMSGSDAEAASPT